MRNIRIILVFDRRIYIHIEEILKFEDLEDLKNSKIFFKIKKILRSIDIGIRVKFLSIVYPIQHFYNPLFFDHYKIHWLNNQLQISQYQYPSIIHDFVASFATIAPSIIANNRRFMSSLHLQLSSGIYNLSIPPLSSTYFISFFLYTSPYTLSSSFPNVIRSLC